MIYFANKAVIVTGGASGLGKALCMELGRRGAKVVVVDIDQEGAEQVSVDINRAGGESIYGYCDVTIYQNALRIVKDVVRKFGKVDIVFNNAGTAIQGDARDLTVEHWRNVIDINLMGVIYGAISAYEVMGRQGRGQIVNIGSLAGLIPIPNEIPYCTSKWAVVGFSHSLREEGRDLGIKVNLVCPGLMHTAIYDKIPWVNVDRQKSMHIRMAHHFVAPERAAKIILHGVERNKSMIIFPCYARLVWWVYRFMPVLFRLFFQKMVRDFRKTRIIQ